MIIEILRKNIPEEEFDYQTLLSCLEGYARPRDKISDLLRKGIIIRVKKGLYIFGEAYRKRPFSREILANLIFGPSYISLEYALQHYGLIPERIEAITSVTTGRSRQFSTSAGLFTYRNIPLEAFRTGMDRLEVGGGRGFLIATPEKAIADKLFAGRGHSVRSQKTLKAYLEEDLRIDFSDLRQLNPSVLKDIARRYRSRKIALLADLMQTGRNQFQKEKSYA